MRSRTDFLAVALTVLLAALTVCAAAAQPPSAGACHRSPSRSEIARALETVKNDPNLASEQTIKTLQWKTATDHAEVRYAGLARRGLAISFSGSNSRRACSCGRPPSSSPDCWSSTSLAQRGGIACCGTRTRSSHQRTCAIWTSGRRAFPRTSAVAARRLWDGGEHRAALALLYRGMLSRLAHVHSIPIRDSSTEGECLALAASGLPRRRLEYTSRVVLVWQRFVYGGHRDTQAATIYGLCDEFARALDRNSPLEPVGGGASV